MNAKEFVSAADGIEIPEALDLTADELNVIKAASDRPFALILLGSSAASCGARMPPPMISRWAWSR